MKGLKVDKVASNDKDSKENELPNESSDSSSDELEARAEDVALFDQQVDAEQSDESFEANLVDDGYFQNLMNGQNEE